MALTRNFRETVQARVQSDPAFRRGLLSEAVESLLGGELELGKELLRDYINATLGFPTLAARTKLHVKTVHQMFGPKGNPTAKNLLEIVAYLQQSEGVRFKIDSSRAALRTRRSSSPRTKTRRN
jgi:DNA-binding phage protein